MLTLLSCSDKFATLELTHSLLLLEFHRLFLISGKCVTQLIRSQVATGRRMEVRHLSCLLCCHSHLIVCLCDDDNSDRKSPTVSEDR